MDVSVAMERKVYTDSSTYRAVISGAWVNLDTIEVWNRHESVSVIRRESVRAKRWSVGVGWVMDGMAAAGRHTRV